MAISLERAKQLAGAKVIFDKKRTGLVGRITAYDRTDRAVLISYNDVGTFDITDTVFTRLLPYDGSNFIYRGYWCQYESDLEFVEDHVSIDSKEKFYFLENDTISKEWVPCRLVSDRSKLIYLKEVPDNTKFEHYNRGWVETQKIPTKTVKFEIRLEVRADKDVVSNIKETIEKTVANMAAFDIEANKGVCDYMITEIEAKTPNEKQKEEIKKPIIINNLEIT